MLVSNSLHFACEIRLSGLSNDPKPRDRRAPEQELNVSGQFAVRRLTRPEELTMQIRTILGLTAMLGLAVAFASPSSAQTSSGSSSGMNSGASNSGMSTGASGVMNNGEMVSNVPSSVATVSSVVRSAFSWSGVLAKRPFATQDRCRLILKEVPSGPWNERSSTRLASPQGHLPTYLRTAALPLRTRR